MEKESKQQSYLQAHEAGLRILFPLLRKWHRDYNVPNRDFEECTPGQIV